MNEKILTVLVVVALVLSAFNLVLMLRTNGTNIIGQPSSVTWQKIQCGFYQQQSTSALSLYDKDNKDSFIYPMWNVELTVQWQNATVQTFALGETFDMGNSGLNWVNLPRILENTKYNVTSITAFILEPPQ